MYRRRGKHDDENHEIYPGFGRLPRESHKQKTHDESDEQTVYYALCAVFADGRDFRRVVPVESRIHEIHIEADAYMPHAGKRQRHATQQYFPPGEIEEYRRHDACNPYRRYGEYGVEQYLDKRLSLYANRAYFHDIEVAALTAYGAGGNYIRQHGEYANHKQVRAVYHVGAYFVDRDGEKQSDTTYSANITMDIDRAVAKQWLTNNNVQNWLPDDVSGDVFVVQVVMSDKVANWVELKQIARSEGIDLATKYINGNQVTVEVPVSNRSNFTIAIGENGWRYYDQDGVLRIWK